MNITITKKQNIRIDGVKYKAQEYLHKTGCTPCILSLKDRCHAVPCSPGERTDGKNVIFVKAEPKWIKVNGVVPDLAPNLLVEWRNKKDMQGTASAVSLIWGIGEDNEVTHYRVVKNEEAA